MSKCNPCGETEWIYYVEFCFQCISLILILEVLGLI